MNIIEMLRSDHNRLDQFFVQIEQTPTPSERLNLFQEMRQMLLLHLHAEESVFYAACSEKGPLRDLTERFYDEHQRIRDSIVLASEIVDETEFNQKIEALIDLSRETFEEEEERLFSRAETIFTREELRELGDELISARERMDHAA